MAEARKLGFKTCVLPEVCVKNIGHAEGIEPVSYTHLFEVDGVVHYCVGNMPGAVPRTSTIALTNATLSYGLQIANKGLEQACKDNEVIYSCLLYTSKTMKAIEEAGDKPYVVGRIEAGEKGVTLC